MRVRLPALIAVISAAAYAACGSDDGSKAVQAGGEGGEGGDPTQSQAGKNNTAGSQNNVGGEGGAGVAGNKGASGDAGAPGGFGGQAGTPGSSGAAGTPGGEGGGGGEGNVDPLAQPAACPTPVNGYTQVVGTEAADTFTSNDVSGQKLIFGLGGDDVFPTEHGGDDCLVGGPGDDDFTNSDEFVNYYVGGPGADTYHITTTGNYLRIADMETGDTIALSSTTFPFLGASGDTPSANNLLSVPGYSTGTPSGVTEGTTIIYDPTSGELWLDWDGGTKGSSVNDKQILTILNKDGYQFSRDDFEID